LEAEQLRLTTAWTRQLTLLADARAYFGRLKHAPMSGWVAGERAAALTAMRNHEVIAAAIDILLRGVERDIALLDRAEATMAESARHLAGRRR
jgi:hypothetical protein